jgi:hypothetical protein
VAAIVATSALLLLRALLWRPLSVSGPVPAGHLAIAGAVHVHTTLSDGGGTPQEVIGAARAAGLSFVVLTDHDNLDAKPLEGYHDGVLVIVGTEVSTTAGHLLGLGIPDPDFRFSGDALDSIEDVRDLGGVSFAAHPLSPRRSFQWTGWDLPGPWGLELLNGDSQWRETSRWTLFQTAALYGLNPRYALLASLVSPDATLRRWDSLLEERDVPGIVGADAHSRIVVGRGSVLRFPSYESSLSVAKNHVLLDSSLTGDQRRDARSIILALAQGRSYIGLDALAPADGFYFFGESGGERWRMGDTAPASSRPTLEAGGALPKGTHVRLLRDGNTAVEGLGHVALPSAAPGVYRVECRVPGWPIPWILSNPIYVFDETQKASRQRRAAWPPPPDPPSKVTLLDSFEGHTVFEGASDSLSRLNVPILDPHGGVGGSGAARMEFHLGVPQPGHPHTFCAIINRASRDLSGKSGITFWIRADGVYRLWVQVRDENPASTDDGTEWWFASVRTSPEWRHVAVPFRRFRSIDRHTDGRLDLDKVRAIVFVLDKGAVKVGTSGTIWLDDVGFY